MINSKSRKWSILIVVTLVAFITNLDSTIVVIGLPKIMEGLNITVVEGLLVITGYIISNSVFLLPAGKLADTLGTKPIFILGLIIFTVSTIFCGIANSGVTLIIFRLIQGAGAALSVSTATPTIVKNFPEEQLGFALGINATSWVIGSVAGPVVGGALISRFGWRSMFFITVPFLIICIAGAFLVMENTEVRIKAKIDWLGVLTFGLGLVSVMAALSIGQSSGWLSVPTIGLFIAAVLLWSAFVIIELRVENPLFDFNLLSYRNYTIGLIITLSYCIAYFSLPLLLTLYLESALKLSPMNAGMLIIPLSIPQLIMGPLGGKFADRFGALRMIVSGIAVLAVMSFTLGNLGPQLSVPALVIPLIIMSIANSIAWPSMAKTILSATPKDSVGSASGMYYTVLNVGRALSQTLVILIIEVSISPALVSKVIVGIGTLSNSNVKGDLIYSINFNLRVIGILFIICLILGLYLAISKEKSNAIKIKRVS
ncbi:DHA2 family efflux MFS transporter permease subunit [Clostridium pasteurianum]|uniref:Drug resistance transporter, EmrB/QacA subfamily n=1 Tax=Clostridium pasteurianum BC1 TaxID=86416 RepID=R4K623_CLOPA|nr:DHA2 family efflux MFS transporter permease subunit [Clostridium pasteurianum]AGK98627.1 drug resistance transporter, EmrB/QacA subfamily [Clostridium pasteurianum BC1]